MRMFWEWFLSELPRLFRGILGSNMICLSSLVFGLKPFEDYYSSLIDSLSAEFLSEIRLIICKLELGMSERWIWGTFAYIEDSFPCEAYFTTDKWWWSLLEGVILLIYSSFGDKHSGSYSVSGVIIVVMSSCCFLNWRTRGFLFDPVISSSSFLGLFN